MKIALLIGINYFGTGCELSGCIQDIITSRDYLASHNYEQFIVLSDDPAAASKLRTFNGISTHPTKAMILLALNQLRATVNNDKTVTHAFIHYSGHGSYVADTTGDEKDGCDEVICAVDGGYITDDELSAIISGFRKDVVVNVLFDCCHSGTALDLPYRWDISNGTCLLENAKNKDFPTLTTFISGCLDTQTSADAYIDNGYSGALTYCFYRSLNEDQTDSSAKSSQHTLFKLVEDVRERLKSGGYDQIPQICSSYQLSGDTLINL